MFLRESDASFLFTKHLKSQKVHFFEEVSKTLSQAVNKYDNFLIAGELNIDISNEMMKVF